MAKQNHLAWIGIGALASSGCVALRYSGPDMTLIPPGLPRQEVVARIGKPDKAHTYNGTEVMAYEWNSAYDSKIGGMWSYVILTNGFVSKRLAQQEPGYSVPPEVAAQMIRSNTEINLEGQRQISERDRNFNSASDADWQRREEERRHQELIRALQAR
jgi:hypothetical protein